MTIAADTRHLTHPPVATAAMLIRRPVADVFEAFVDVVSKHGSRSHEDAEAYMRELETAKDRYRPDLWG